MANTTVGVDVNVKTNVAGSIGELKALKKQLKETAAGSADFKRLTNEINDLEDKIKGAKQGAGDLVDQLASAGGPLGMLGNALNKAKISTVSFGTALKATGIGLVVSLIAGLVAAFAESEKATKKLQPLLIGFQKIFAGIFAAIEPVFNAFIDFAVEALPMVTKGIGMAYSAVTSFIQGLGLLASAVGKLIKGDFSGAWDSAKEAVAGFGDRYEAANKRFIDGTKEVTKTEQEELDKRKEAAEKAAEERRKREEAELQYQEQLEELRRKKLDESIKFAKSLRDKDFKLKEEERIRDEKLEKEKAEKEANAIKTRVETDLFWLNKRVQDSKAANAQQLADDIATKQARADVANSYADLASGVGNLLRQVAGQNKTLQIAAIVAEQASSVARIIANTSVANAKAVALTPITGGQPFVGINTATAAISIASTIAAAAKGIQQIKSSNTSVAGAAALPRSSASAPISPEPPLVNTRTQLDATSIQQLGSATNRAYVVESDVTNSQERIRRINRAARLS